MFLSNLPFGIAAVQALNPWNAVTLPLPAEASLDELHRLRAQADYCVRQAHFLMEAARAGTYRSLGFPADGAPDAHEEFEQDRLNALERYEELSERIARIEDETPGQAF
ncbi:MAG: hypothetical protein ACLPWS_19575 [Rhodomicrobium sp.]